jgi:POT family proton-dependent oligopeptide transporter
MIPAGKVLVCAARHGFIMKKADPEYQLERHGKKVSWTCKFSEEITRGLAACRVL